MLASTLTLAVIAGMSWANGPVVETVDPGPAVERRTFRVDSRTGELRPLEADGRAGASVAFSVAPDGTNFIPQTSPTPSGGVAPGWSVLGWADCPFNVTVDQVVIRYGTNVPDNGTPGVPGLSCTVRLYDQENGLNDPSTVLVKEVVIPSLPGSTFSSGYAYITLVVDLDVPIELGDRDGFDAFGNPAGGTGADEDGDQFADIGWSYSWTLPAGVNGTIGPAAGFAGNWKRLTADQEPIRSWGSEGGFEVFTAAHTGYRGRFATSAQRPALYRIPAIELRGPVAKDPQADLDGSGGFDFGDFLQFFNRFDSGAE
jgi:hypothetical protein